MSKDMGYLTANSYEFSDKCVHEPVFGGERRSSQDALLKTQSSYSHPLSHEPKWHLGVL
jgi:hypothetical protein